VIIGTAAGIARLVAMFLAYWFLRFHTTPIHKHRQTTPFHCFRRRGQRDSPFTCSPNPLFHPLQDDHLCQVCHRHPQFTNTSGII